MFICHASFVIYGNKNLINDYDLKERFLFSPVWELRSSFMFKCLLFCVLLSSSGSLENYVGFLYLFIFKTSFLILMVSLDPCSLCFFLLFLK